MPEFDKEIINTGMGPKSILKDHSQMNTTVPVLFLYSTRSPMLNINVTSCYSDYESFPLMIVAT